MNSKHGHKKKPTLVRQNTFSLDKHETGASRKLEGLSRVGIAAILDRADKICNLSPDVREYLASHLTMMMEETERLIRENDQLRDEISLGNSNSDKKIKTFQKQLEKERAKSKILLSRVKEDPTAAGSEDVILIANHHRAPQNESEVTTEVTQLSVPPRKDKKHNRRHSRSGRSGKKSASLASSLPSSLSSEDIQMKKMSQEFWSINQSAEIEKTRLSELVTLLSGQLSSAEEAGSEAELKLREEIQKCARLELSLERAQLDLRDSGKLSNSSASSSKRTNGYRKIIEEDLHKISIENLKWEIIKLKEEIELLKKELEQVRKSREEMVRIYGNMLEETRVAYTKSLSK